MSNFPGIDNEIVTSDFRGTWRDLPVPTRPPVAAMLIGNQYEAFAAIYGHLVASKAETLMTDRLRLDDQMRESLRDDGFALVEGLDVQPPKVARDAMHGLLWLLTSGSTGRPKRVSYTLKGLTTVTTPQPSRRWMMGYTPGTYAWWQVVSLMVTQPEQSVVALEPKERFTWPAIALRESVTAVSGTPTFFWRAVLHHWDELRRLKLEQISMGTEQVEQALLDRLREAQPNARILWAYGSTEHGLSVIVRDGRVGFPAAWLKERSPGKLALRIEEGELLVETSPGSCTYQHTGDCAQVVGDRVMLTGRMDGNEIHIGGSKIAASTIRQVLIQHPAVAWARVRGRRIPIIGYVPVVDIVLHHPVEETELRQWCMERLPDYGVPRKFQFLKEIPETPAGKSQWLTK